VGNPPKDRASRSNDLAIADLGQPVRRSNAKPDQTGRFPTQANDSAERRLRKRDVTPTLVNQREALMPRKRYKLLAVDLDGTLLNHDGAPHAQDVEAVHALQKAGVIVTIITGRLFSGTKPSADAIGVVGPVGCADGSQIWTAGTCETLVHHTFSTTAALALAATFARNQLVSFLFAGDTIVHDAAGQDFVPFVRLWSNDVRAIPCALEHPCLLGGGLTAAVALGAEHQVRAAVEQLRALEPSLQIAAFAVKKLGEMWGCIIRAEGGTKGTALAWIARHHGIELDATVCVGDWLNDLPMMAVAGRSFAMGQAPDAVRAAVSDVLVETSTTGGGIALIARHVFGVVA
jgi:hydroxymethylpyrimidine pyrophosphatase-like HAD family hydrolase